MLIDVLNERALFPEVEGRSFYRRASLDRRSPVWYLIRTFIRRIQG